MGANAALYAGSGDSDNAPFHVTYNGHLHAENADISGTINASSGTIAGWNVTENSLEKGDSILSPNQLKIVKAGVAEKLVIDFSVPGQARIDVGTGGIITLNGIDFTYNDLYRLKTEILGGEIEDNKSISVQRVEKKGEQNEQDI
jgi:predicted phage tail protein